MFLLFQVNFNVAKFSLSPDMKYVLFAYEVKQVSLVETTTCSAAAILVSSRLHLTLNRFSALSTLNSMLAYAKQHVGLVLRR